MSQMITKSFVAGFAIFSMLFGSGNIVFPLVLGKTCPDNWPLALFGWLIAAVLIPMIGYYGAMLFDADRKKYLSPIGKHATSLIMFIIMMLVGPFGVLARIVNVAFGGINNLAPEISIWLFSALFTAVTVALAFHPGKIVQLIGIVFTPLKFGGIAVIVLGALYFGGSLSHFTENPLPPTETLITGFNMGYQTMDLLASLIMAGEVYLYLKRAMPEADRDNKKKLLKFTGTACLIGGIILSIAYIGLLLIGVQYSDRLSDTPAESILGKIAELSMGYSASWFVSIVIAVSCMATAIILSSVFTDYIHDDVLKKKFDRKIILVFVGIIMFAVSLLGFGQICSFLGMILEKIYPVLMLFIGGRIVYYYAVINKK
ncbi:MAG: branched-chain amino acid transport system II carrier protein [Holosporales bacterium]|jgi:LIVCS family branched-chain amino acid:cation transporter|nr:branched-chain amino acid transport system II carrier protein [Holosporales bacterium]